MITYEYTNNKGETIRVKLEGKVVGVILPVEGAGYNPVGWQYFPKGSKEGGEVFKTIGEVQASLEAE